MIGETQVSNPDLMSFLEKITDPTLVDTDGDGMSDGFEYWFLIMITIF